MDHDTKQDPELQAKVNAWKKPFEEYIENVIGVTEADLDGGDTCKEVECPSKFCCLFAMRNSPMHVSKALLEISLQMRSWLTGRGWMPKLMEQS